MISNHLFYSPQMIYKIFIMFYCLFNYIFVYTKWFNYFSLFIGCNNIQLVGEYIYNNFNIFFISHIIILYLYYSHLYYFIFKYIWNYNCNYIANWKKEFYFMVKEKFHNNQWFHRFLHVQKAIFFIVVLVMEFDLFNTMIMWMKTMTIM